MKGLAVVILSTPEQNFCKNTVRADISFSNPSDINVIIDMSNGLNEGISATKNAAMEPVMKEYIGKAHFYRVAEKMDNAQNLSFNDEEDAYNYFIDKNNYGSWSIEKWCKQSN